MKSNRRNKSEFRADVQNVLNLYADSRSAKGSAHPPVYVGSGGLSLKLGVATDQALSLDNIDYTELTGVGAQYDMVGFVTSNVLGAITPSSSPGSTDRLLRTATDGALTLRYLTMTDILKSSSYTPSLVGWQIAPTGDAQLNDVTITGDMQTGDYVTGSAGWRIAGSGNAELGTLDVRGAVKTTDFVAGSAGWSISVAGATELASIVMRGDTSSLPYVASVNGWKVTAEGVAELGTIEVRGVTQTTNYVADSSGWTVSNTGGAEFGAVDVRGIVQTTNYASGSAGWTVSNTGDAQLNRLDLRADIQSLTYVSRTTGWEVSNAGDADFRNIFASALEVQTFIYDNTLATAGTRILTKSLAIVSQDFTVPTTTGTLYVFDLPGATDTPVFTNGDTVVMRHIDRSTGLIVRDSYGTVSAYTDLADGEQSWTFTRVSGTVGDICHAGTTILDYGVSGDGVITDAVTGTYAPYVDVATWAGAPTSLTVHTRMGYIEGVTSVSEYGIVSKISATEQVIMSDTRIELHGASLSLYSGSTQTVRLDPDTPSIAIGSPVPATYGSTGIWFGLNGGQYRASIGNSTDYVRWDGALLTVRGKLIIEGDSYFNGTVTIATSGGIYQGTGTFASPTRGLKVWNDSGYGRLAGYNASILQAEFDTQGRISAGGGSVILDSGGLTLKPTGSGLIPLPADSITWQISSYTAATVGATYSAWFDMQLLLETKNPTDTASSKIDMRAYSVTSGDYSNIAITTDTLSIVAPNINATGTFAVTGVATVTDDIRGGGGLSVGSTTTNPATGEIQATTDARIGGGLYVGSLGTNPATGAITATGTIQGNLVISTTDARLNGGLSVGDSGVNPGTGTVRYTGNLTPVRGGVAYTGYTYVPKGITYAIGGVTKTAGTYTVTYTDLGVPSTAVAVWIGYALRPVSTGGRLRAGWSTTDPQDIQTTIFNSNDFVRDGGIATMNSGNIYFKTERDSVANGTYLWCMGYFI